MNITIMESLGITQEELNTLKAPFEKMGCTFKCYEKTNDVHKLIDQAKDADAIILANMPMPEEVINACYKLKFIDIAFTGVDHVAMDAIRARGIVASNASGYSNVSVAELGVGMVISLLRNVPQVEQRCRNGMTKDGLVGSELHGKTVGIIGMGKIGKNLPNCIMPLVVKFLPTAGLFTLIILTISSRFPVKNYLSNLM